MNANLSREELIKLVSSLMEGEGTEEEVDHKIDLLEGSLSHPHVSNMIFWPDQERTPEEIVDIALAYEPPALPAPSKEKRTKTQLVSETAE